MNYHLTNVSLILFFHRKMIGSGVFGTVYEVDQDKCRKIIPLDHVNIGFREIFGMLLTRDIPNTSKLINVEWSDNGLSIIMPKYRINLFDWIKTCPSIEERTRVAKEIVQVILTIHSMGIVHSDLKLENIMLTKNNQVVLIDWGFSGFEGTSLYNNTTRLYRSVRLTGKCVDEIYSLGILLIEIFSKSIDRYYTPTQYDEIVDFLPISSKWKSLIKKMICRIPKVRPSSQDILNAFDLNITVEQEKYNILNILEEECLYPEFLKKIVDKNLIQTMIYNYTKHETYRIFATNCDLKDLNNII